ncbi:MAG: putative toxin-antitoxin system toxin component, PIN family [Halorhabdus sp.]
MNAVLDTNVLISAVIATGIPHEVVVAGYDGEYRIVASQATIQEFRETLQKYPERFGLDDDEIQTEVETLQYYAEIVAPDEELKIVDADPDDDKFLEVGVTADADYVVSGDQHLLDIDSFRDIDIVTPREFYATLDD